MTQVATAVASLLQAVPQLMRQRHELEEQLAQPGFAVHLSDLKAGISGQNDPNAELKAAIERSLMVFETTLLSAALAEASVLEHVSSFDDLLAKMPRLRLLAASVIGHPAEDILARYPGFLAAVQAQAPTREQVDEYYAHLGVHMDLLVRQVKALVASCPIRDLERTAIALGGIRLAHQHRIAFDRLSAFLHRHELGDDDAFKILGHAFMEGRVSLDEILAATGLPPEDAVRLIEDLGFARSAETLLTSVGSRPESVARLRADRLARRGQPVVDEGRIRREVIATQRIEDVDARPWLPTHQA